MPHNGSFRVGLCVARSQASKLAALGHPVGSAAQTKKREDDSLPDPVVIVEESNPPPYSTSNPPAEPPENPLRPTVPECMCEVLLRRHALTLSISH